MSFWIQWRINKKNWIMLLQKYTYKRYTYTHGLTWLCMKTVQKCLPLCFLLPIKRSRQSHQLSASFLPTSQLILPEFRHISATELTSPANFLVLSLVIIPQVHPLPFCLYLESSGLSLVFLFIRSKDFWVSFIF